MATEAPLPLPQGTFSGRLKRTSRFLPDLTLGHCSWFGAVSADIVGPLPRRGPTASYSAPRLHGQMQAWPGWRLRLCGMKGGRWWRAFHLSLCLLG